ncbi:MAG: hypothetical protein A2440_06570 [Stygiobacter sp. RIFOXYC2_FULL_38_25]|nr:MAG: hypothetical protein A2299_01405 [Stygiobacter sp. RIFOXYB2_FULL_37_11]OGV11489.1 MAG: hypothetical protein A2237_05385 [Stygiobacter sp. RIFOXYA2_FULL_38_8]OGV15008.1 MAG: hypothetical protein A2440_06570 [Stygiobacter sp. RIFOXYC2_FULL_38_25]OGV79582.1 MAG: hypothetical protein A2X65_18650 [Stygiobacter sp. GWF2_38_21]
MNKIKHKTNIFFLKTPFPKINFDRYFIFELFFALIYFTNIILASISNYTTPILIVKTISSSTLAFTFFFLQKHIYKHELQFSRITRSRFSLILLTLFTVSFVSLLIGNCNLLGLQKFYLITVQLIPIIIITKLSLLTWNEQRTYAFIYSVLLIGFTASVIAIVLKPFNPFVAYHFSLNRWSHVVFGRFLVIPTVLSLFLLYKSISTKTTIVNYFMVLLFCFTLISSGFRAGAAAIYLFLILCLIYNSLNQKSKFLNPKSLLLITLIIGLPLLILLFQPTNFVNRISSLEQIAVGSSIEDGSITSRITAYKTAWLGGWGKPLLGHGLGTFQFANGELTRSLKYPHNIFLEFFYEMGLIGLIFFILLLLLIFNSIKKYGFWLISLYCIFLWLSLFSKDIPSNVLLFTGLAFIDFSKQNFSSYLLRARLKTILYKAPKRYLI